jgi:imidazolonepropionase-like amidohydrolase
MTTTPESTRGRLLLVALSAILAVALRADAPQVFAITGARVVPVSGPSLESATVVVRGGLIESVGAAAAVPPDATVIDGKGLTVYPGLIDLGTQAGLDVPQIAAPKDPRTREEVERWKRQVLIRPQLEAAQCVKQDGADLKRFTAAGITSVLAVPGGGAITGQSSLLHTAVPDDVPQIGNIVEPRQRRFVVRTPVFLHVRFLERTPGDGYPESLMGVIAFVRQAFVDAAAAATERARAEKLTRAAAGRPADVSLDGLRTALATRMPVAFEAQEAHQIRRALAFAKEFGLDAVIEGGLEADQVIDELRAQNARVLLSLNFPTRSRLLPPDADESLSALRARANAPKVAAALDKAGIRFAFQSAGLRDPSDFVKNAARAVTSGLPEDAALKALTLNAASIVGVGKELGSIEKGKVANLIVVSGNLLDGKATIRHVFVEGRSIPFDPPAVPRAGRGGE